MAESATIALPGRQCLCQGDGQTWADAAACPVHDGFTSPLAKQVRDHYEQGIVNTLRAENERLRDALRVIVGPEDSGPWIDTYRAAGGGYEGLQAIARTALRDEDTGGTR